MRLFVCGDVHGDIDYDKIRCFREYMRNVLTMNDYLVVCGDFGVIWDGNAHDHYFKEVVYKDFPCTILWVDGNHENFNVLYKYPVEEWNGGKIHRISDNILHLMRGEVFKVNGVSFLALGGAMSTDRGYDTGNNSFWWPEEIPSLEEQDNAIKNLDLVGNMVSYIFTHEGPGKIVKEIFLYDRLYDPVFSGFLDHISEITNFQQWFFGHHHTDESYGKYTCLFDTIYELEVPPNYWPPNETE